MASSELAQEMNRSLGTKLAIYENIAEYVQQRPVIFTSRAEIWSTDRNPLIITGHPFPSVLPCNNPNRGDLTREMMEYYRKLPAAKEKGGHHLVLILFELNLFGITEVHAVFFRGESSAKELPAAIYLKKPYPTDVLTRERSTEKNSVKTRKTSVSIVLAGESVACPAPIHSLSVTTTTRDKHRNMVPIESRLGPLLCDNLEKKVKIFQNEGTQPGVHGVTFTSVPNMWESEIPWLVIKHQMPLIPYNHKRFDIEDDILKYVTHVARRNNCVPFYAYSRRFGDDQFADVHLLFCSQDKQEASVGLAPTLSSLSSNSDLLELPVPARRLATIQHRWSSSPSTNADRGELASSADRSCSFESIQSDSVRSLHLVRGEYLCYSSPTDEGHSKLFHRQEVMVERTVRNSTSSFEPPSLDSVDDDRRSVSLRSSVSREIVNEYHDAEQELQSITLRLDQRLMHNLDEKLRFYANRSPEDQDLVCIFTDDTYLWNMEWDPVLYIVDLPPIPAHYDHESHDIVQDIVDYMLLSHVLYWAPVSQPLYLSILRFGRGRDTEVHIMLSQHRETASHYYFETQLPTAVDPSSSSSAHSLLTATSRTSAGMTHAQVRVSSVPLEFKSQDSRDALPDLPEDLESPLDPEDHVP